MSSIQQDQSVVATAELVLHCPKCGAINETDSFRFRTRDRWLGLVTIWVSHETALQCPACEATFCSRLLPDELASLSPDQLKSNLRLRVGFVQKFLVVAAWIVICACPVSFVMFLIARFQLPKSAIGWRRLTQAGLWISGLAMLFMAIAFVFGD